MNDQELDRRLAIADPARATPAELDAVVDRLVQRPVPRRRRRGLAATATAGGALLLVGALAAFTDLDSFLLSVPPFATLDEGTVRTTDGLPYVPVGETDRGEQCAIWVDFGGLTAEDIASVNDYWSSADPTDFAAGVNERVGSVPTTDDAESSAKLDQLLEDFGRIVPGIAWGSAPPGTPWAAGEPHLTSFSTVCADDMDALR